MQAYLRIAHGDIQMKLVYSGLLFLSLMPAATSAAVLLERSTAAGFVMEPYALSTRCTIDESGQLAIHMQLSDLGSDQVRQLQLSLPALRATIGEARHGRLETEPYPVDAEASRYVAYRRIKADDSYQEVLLFETNNGGLKRVNNTPAAIKLRNFLDLHCDGQLSF